MATQLRIVLADGAIINMLISSTGGNENLQPHISLVFQWPTDTNMIINTEKFQLHHGRNEDIKSHTKHKTETGLVITRKMLKGQAMMMYDDFILENKSNC